MEIYSTPVDIGRFSAAFSNFKEEAFRLELLDAYRVPEEAEAFKAFLRGDPEPATPPHAEWLDFLQKAAQDGKRIRRVRGVARELTPYQRFEIEWGYLHSVPAGEDIRLFHIDDHQDLLAEVPVAKDFWFFDQEIGFFVEYDFLGRFLGASSMADSVLDTYKRLMERLASISLPLDEFIKRKEG